jgi:hypothetical protein
MKIGYSVEGSTDRALIKGLKNRWCPDAELIEGRFRGSTHESLRREYQKICDEFQFRSVDWMVFLTDSNTRPWRDVQRDEREKFPPECQNRAIHGVADRNVESWLCADADWLGKRLSCDPNRFRCDDPKGPFEGAMEITRDDKREDEIALIVKDAPLGVWLANNKSFENFYDQVRDASQQSGCAIENVREHSQ